MTGPGRVPPGAVTPGESAQSSETVRGEQPLAWQNELDGALSDLDSRLSHPRRRASDVAPQPVLPQLGQVNLTSELLDEIAWRVSEQMRRSQPETGPASLAPAATAVAAEAAAPTLPKDTALVIRIRRPLFSWRFWRRRSRRRQSMITFSDYRVT
jgi:hypothetical protein